MIANCLNNALQTLAEEYNPYGYVRGTNVEKFHTLEQLTEHYDWMDSIKEPIVLSYTEPWGLDNITTDVLAHYAHHDRVHVTYQYPLTQEGEFKTLNHQAEEISGFSKEAKAYFNLLATVYFTYSWRAGVKSTEENTYPPNLPVAVGRLFRRLVKRKVFKELEQVDLEESIRIASPSITEDLYNERRI